MKAPAAVSPFAAKSSQEQKEQWIWWQCQQPAGIPMETTEIDPPEKPPVPELRLPRQEGKPGQPQQRQPTRHSQYDAVVQRMQNATRKTKTFTSIKS